MEKVYRLIGKNILVINKYMKMYLKSRLSEHNLNTAEGMTLLVLYGKHGEKKEIIVGKTQDEIIEELHYHKAVMTRTMQALEKKGLVIRRLNEKDARSYFFIPTEKAMRVKEIIIGILKDWSDMVLQDLDESEIESFDFLLGKMCKRAKDALN